MTPLYVLAGGRSSRFGSDKARALLDGVALLRRVVDGLTGVTGPATVVAAADGVYADLGLRTIGDREPGLGPMGGLVTALHDAEGSLFLVSCDLREPRARWATSLIDAGGTAAFRTERGWEPLFAHYGQEALPVAERLLQAGEASLQVLLDEVGATALDPPPGWPQPPSFNTPEDLPRAAC